MDQRKMAGGGYTLVTVGPFKPAVSGDDARWEPGGTTSFTGTSLIVGLFSGLRYRSFVRFPGVTVPQGKTINSAILTLRSTTAQPLGNATVIFNIYGNAADNPAAPTTAGTAEALALTTATLATTAGPVAATTDYTFDVTGIIQEIVSRSGWASGNALILVLKESGSSTDYFNPESWDNAGTNEPKLDIVYQN